MIDIDLDNVIVVKLDDVIDVIDRVSERNGIYNSFLIKKELENILQIKLSIVNDTEKREDD